MAQEGHVTPEKQLLNLIEGSDSKKTKARVYAAKHHGLSFLSPAAWKGRISFFKQALTGIFKGGDFSQLDVRSINRLLGLSIFILAVYFTSSVYFSMINLKRTPNLNMEFQTDARTATLPESSSLKKAVSYYLEKVRQRSIFKMGAKKVEEAEKVADVDVKPTGPSSAVIEATQHLKLVGISWSDDPDVMIEDTRALRTFFAKRGQHIGEIKVEAIFKDKIVLSYNGEEIELK